MRMRTRTSIMLSLPLLLGALMAISALSSCSSGPSRVSASSPTVSYNVMGKNLSQADSRAADYCDRFDQHASLLSVQNGVATYGCGTSTAQVPAMATPAAPPAGTSPIVGGPAE